MKNCPLWPAGGAHVFSAFQLLQTTQAEALDRKEDTDITDEAFTLAEMVRAINRSRPASRGKIIF